MGLLSARAEIVLALVGLRMGRPGASTAAASSEQLSLTAWLLCSSIAAGNPMLARNKKCFSVVCSARHVAAACDVGRNATVATALANV